MPVNAFSNIKLLTQIVEVEVEVPVGGGYEPIDITGIEDDAGLSLVGDAFVDSDGYLNLDGTGDTAAMADDPAYDYASGQVFSVSCLFKATALSGDSTLFSKHSGATLYEGYAFILESDGNAVTYYNTGGTSSGNKNTFATKLETGKWYSFIVNLNPDRTIDLYINGTRFGATAAELPAANSGQLYLGAQFNGSYYNLYNGLLDSVEIRNNGPFTDAEINSRVIKAALLNEPA